MIKKILDYIYKPANRLHFYCILFLSLLFSYVFFPKDIMVYDYNLSIILSVYLIGLILHKVT